MNYNYYAYNKILQNWDDNHIGAFTDRLYSDYWYFGYFYKPSGKENER